MKFMHISDTHLGIDPGVDEQGRKRSPVHLWEALEEAIGVAKQENIDFLLVSGDLFHYSPSVEELDKVNGWFCRIPQTQIVLIAGNHDYLEPNSGYIQYKWPEHVHFLMENHITSVDFPEQNVTVYGLSYWQPQLEARLYDDLIVENEDRINIFLAHGGDPRHIPYDAESLLKKGVDYIAGGHLHTRRILVENRAVIAGPLQPTESKETGEFGYWLIELEKEGETLQSKAEFFPIYEYPVSEIG